MLTYDMTQRQERPLYEHLYLCMRRDIEHGIIAPDEKLPSKRSLAKHLGVSLITVEGAYAQLVAEGYVRTVERKGYYACVLPRFGEEAPARASGTSRFSTDARVPGGSGGSLEPRSSVRAGIPDSPGSSPKTAASHEPVGDLEASREDAGAHKAASGLIADFRSGAATSGLFPYDSWSKALRSALAEETEQSLAGESDAQGSLRLRRAICRYLKGVRGMDVAPDQVFIGAGAQYLYHMLVLLLGRGRTVALEDPGYPRLAKIYEADGMGVAPVPMDGQGMAVDALRRSQADIVHITPSHQYPTGQVTSIARRYELLAWAAEDDDRVIIEDDYDCEFRFAGKPIPALQSIDVGGHVIYANTFSKSLGAGFRVGYVVLPDRLARRYREKLGFYSCTVSAIDQLALARFMESGSYERHVNRMRIHYRGVRNKLVGSLETSAFRHRVRFAALDAGLHFLMGLKGSDALPDGRALAVKSADHAEGRSSSDALPDGEALAAAFLREGVALLPLSHFRMKSGPHEEPDDGFVWFMVNFAGLEKSQIPAAVAAMERALGY